MPVYKPDIALASALTRVINYPPKAVIYTHIGKLQIVASLTIAIHNHIIFIEQATGACIVKHFRFVMHRFHGKLACLFKPVKVTENNEKH
jgi:hypothetical protein